MPDYPERPDIRHYAIGDFAKKAGVSTHFLKFYEEKGILHPMVQDNGYRYYNIQDASLVLECRRLKNMGFSVREIERGINDCTPQEEQDVLARQEKAQLEELHRQQMHLWGLQNLRAALRFCEVGEWSVRRVPDIWFLPHTLNREFIQEDAIYDQLPEWLEWMPVVTSAQSIRYTTEGEFRAVWGLSVEQEEAQRLGFAPEAPAQLLHFDRVLERYCSWNTREPGHKEETLLQQSMEEVRQLNLIPEPVLFRKVFCYTEKDGARWVHCVLWTPVRQK